MIHKNIHRYLVLPFITCLFMWLYFRYLKRSSMKTWWSYPKTMVNNLIYNMLLLLLVVVINFPSVGIIQNLFINKHVFSSDCLDDGHVLIKQSQMASYISYYLNRSVYKTHSYMQSWNISNYLGEDCDKMWQGARLAEP